MKTRTLALVALPHDYVEDLKTLETMSLQQVQAVGRWFFSQRVPTAFPPDRDVMELSARTKVPAGRICSVLRCLPLTITLGRQYGDSLEEFVADLAAERVVSEDVASKLRAAIGDVTTVDEYREPAATVVEQSLPSFRSVAARCVVLPVFRGEGRVEEELADWRAAVSRLIPAVVVEVNIGGAAVDDKRCWFSLSEDQLVLLIDRLQSAAKQLEVLKSVLTRNFYAQVG